MPTEPVRVGAEPPSPLELQRALSRVLGRDGLAVTVLTSGSSGHAREVALSAEALRASAAASAQVLGGQGSWLLALPLRHIAGIQVVVRSLLAGTEPAVMPSGEPFASAGFATAARALGAGRRYTSLVPTQLQRLLDDGPGTEALRTFDAVLVGGAPCPPTLVERARRLEVRVVTTYGMTETAGGCVYDGRPFDGTEVVLDPSERIRISGPTLAAGYLRGVGAPTPLDLVDSVPGEGGTAFETRAGRRWLLSPDLGALGADGRLAVVGRMDHVIMTGGIKVAPAPVEALLAAVPGIAAACVVGIPDPHWGERVVAVLVRSPETSVPVLADLRRRVSDRLGPAHAPREIIVVDALPTRGPGKVDRQATTLLATERLARPS